MQSQQHFLQLAFKGFVLPGVPLALTILVFCYLFGYVGSHTSLDLLVWHCKLTGQADQTPIPTALGLNYLFFLATALLILLNNIFLYIPDIAQTMEDSHTKQGRAARKFAFATSIITTVAVLVWILRLAFTPPRPHDAINEWCGIVLFSAFFIADAIFWLNSRQQLESTQKSTERLELNRAVEYYRNQTLFTDGPVVLGLLVVFFTGRALETKIAGATNFSEGFQCGAVAMHLAYSQVVFLILSWRFRGEIRQEVIENA